MPTFHCSARLHLVKPDLLTTLGTFMYSFYVPPFPPHRAQSSLQKDPPSSLSTRPDWDLQQGHHVLYTQLYPKACKPKSSICTSRQIVTQCHCKGCYLSNGTFPLPEARYTDQKKPGKACRLSWMSRQGTDSLSLSSAPASTSLENCVYGQQREEKARSWFGGQKQKQLGTYMLSSSTQLQSSE